MIKDGCKKPMNKIIIIGVGGGSFRRDDGIYVIPFNMLRD
jgi:hypothetical protein